MSEGSCLLKFCSGAARRRARLLIRCAVSSSAPWCLPALLSAAERRRRRLCGQPRMEGAPGGPRSASELVAAAKGYGELLAAGLVTQTALLAAPRARSSTGDAGSPAPTSVSAMAAAASAPAAAPLSAVAAPLSLLDQPAAAVAPARSAPAKRAAEERSEAAVQATLRALHPPSASPGEAPRADGAAVGGESRHVPRRDHLQDLGARGRAGSKQNAARTRYRQRSDARARAARARRLCALR